MADSYPLSLSGIAGQLVCPGGCEVELTPTYVVDPEDATNFIVGSVAVTDGTDQTNLRFDPSGAPLVHFYNGSAFEGDHEYMVFGYWREDPISPISPYDSGSIGVFAQAINSTATGTESQGLPGTIDATFRGTAVGMYVEQEQRDPIDTHRQGEFVASAILTVDGAPPLFRARCAIS